MDKSKPRVICRKSHTLPLSVFGHPGTGGEISPDGLVGCLKVIAHNLNLIQDEGIEELDRIILSHNGQEVYRGYIGGWEWGSDLMLYIDDINSDGWKVEIVDSLEG